MKTTRLPIMTLQLVDATVVTAIKRIREPDNTAELTNNRSVSKIERLVLGMALSG